jgi:hypothetical protein
MQTSVPVPADSLAAEHPAPQLPVPGSPHLPDVSASGASPNYLGDIPREPVLADSPGPAPNPSSPLACHDSSLAGDTA